MIAVRLITGAAIAAVLIALAGIIPAAALSDPGIGFESASVAQQANNGERAVEPMLLWTLVAVVAASVIMGALYLLKRRVGGFPAEPEWVAPITIMPSRENPTEETFGLEPEDGHDDHH
jgi:hypothetical protein